MPSINAVRLVNINYNNNTMRINDEIMYYNNINTFISLRNGGGKSVMVQLLTSVFVGEKYRKVNDREYESFFTTNKPSYIMVEWKLDGGNTYMMNGFMVRKSQNVDEGNKKSLEIISFVSEYDQECLWDLKNLPILEKDDREMKLIGFQNTKSLFESFKRNRESIFFYYDMGSENQITQYFKKLREYRVDRKEWESVIYKINLNEGGLAKLFSDSKDERSLTEKWFLRSVEQKINKGNDKIKKFGDIVGKYIYQYYQNEGNIIKRQLIKKFKEFIFYDDFVNGRISVYNAAINLNICHNKKIKQENSIVNFRDKINECISNKNEEFGEISEKIGTYENGIIHTKHEMYSYEIYNLVDQIEKNKIEIDKFEKEINKNENKISDIEKRIDSFLCRQQYDRYINCKRKYNDVTANLRTLNLSMAGEKEKRRKELGAKLYLCYESLYSNIEDEIYILRQQKVELNKDRENVANELKNTRDDIIIYVEKKGRIDSQIENFDVEEDNYNKKFNRSLSRNLLRKYEEGALIIEEQNIKNSLDNTIEKLREAKEKKSFNEQNIIKNNSDVKNTGKLLQENESIYRDKKKEFEGYNIELEKRKINIKYIGYNFDNQNDIKAKEILFDKEKIIKEFDDKIREINISLNKLNQEKKNLESEISLISEGRLYDISMDLKDELDRLNIPLNFGLAWLRKNNKSFSENLAIIEKNPFIPYSLILTDTEYSRVLGLDKNVVTNLPIPIILRGDVEKGEFNLKNNIFEIEKLKFFINFDKMYLDEESVLEYIRKKKEEIDNLSEKISNREKEINLFQEKRSEINNQKVNKELMDGCKRKLDNLNHKGEQLRSDLKKFEVLKKRLEEEKKSLEKTLEQLNKDKNFFEKNYNSIEKFREVYEKYIENMIKYDKYKNLIFEAEGKVELLEEKNDSIIESINRNEIDFNTKIKRKDEIDNKILIFKEYEKESEITEIADEEFNNYLGLEAEYEALAKEIDGNIKALQERIKELKKDLHSEEKIYKDKRTTFINMYSVSETEFDRNIPMIIYDTNDEVFLDKDKKNLQSKNKILGHNVNEKRSYILVHESEIKNLNAKINEECFVGNPLSREEINYRDFKEEINVLNHNKGQAEKELENIKNRISELESIKSALAEFDDYSYQDFEIIDASYVDPMVSPELMNKANVPDSSGAEKRINISGSMVVEGSDNSQKPENESVGQNIIIGEFGIDENLQFSSDYTTDLNIEKMSKEKLDFFVGSLKRDLKEINQKIVNQENKINSLLRDIFIMSDFSDTFFNRPLQVFLGLYNNPGSLITQINTTLNVYDELVKKMDVDLSIIDKEKKNIIEELLEFVKILNEELLKIDDNSNIKIHNISKKMLTISLPEWSSNIENYSHKMKIYLENLTDEVIKIYKNNSNPDEYIGTKLTSFELFDSVVGLSNVEIKTLKIEENKEYNITWAEASKLSGGEGFVTCFSVISSLLHYMRMDESDIFADTNEKMVLIMDNPFGATYSEHLLIPMVEMSKKNNIQLICLSGLGGTEIYSRFDNIYILKLVEAGLKNNRSYIVSEHYKGAEPSEMVTVRFNVENQIRLF
ncbi:MAG: hypothetical protein K6G11_10195 [Lachnospiraceae bacterium]|nr:hypothetical protein [Lachnospiraceae bacterium]